MTRVVLRADGTGRIGLGHVARALALADELRDRGHAAVLALGGRDAIELARLRGMEATEVATGASADGILDVAGSHGAALAVTDLANSEVSADDLTALHRALRGRLRAAAFTSETASLPADVVITPYVGAAAPEGEAPERYLVGPRYFVLRHAMRLARRRPRRAPDGRVRVTVAIGGADPSRLTPGAIRGALDGGARGVRAVIGPAFAATLADEIRSLASDQVAVTTDEGLVDGLVWADIAITGDGLLKYECAALGVPALVARSPQTDTKLTERFPSAGTALRTRTSPATPAEIAAEVARLTADRELRGRMSTEGRRLIDGSGAARILDALGLE